MGLGFGFGFEFGFGLGLGLEVLLVTHRRSLPHLTHRRPPSHAAHAAHHPRHAAHAAHALLLLVRRGPLQMLQVARLIRSRGGVRVRARVRGDN